MSKICNRNYSEGSMLAKEMVRGIAICPNCKQPARAHGMSLEQRALIWSLSDNTGISSKAIAKHMIGAGGGSMWPPSDADDRNRCINLLQLVPEWITRLPEMVQYDQQHDAGIVISSAGITANTNSWQKQIDLIISEGKF